MDAPWEHPDWYDLHDTTHTAGPEREPEHYRELVIALPPLDQEDHLVDIGAGTGKLVRLIVESYPRLGQITLIEPNAAKLERARERLSAALPDTEVTAIPRPLGEAATLPPIGATLATIGSVLMPIMELRGGSLADGRAWLRQVLAEVHDLLCPGGWFYDLETLAAPWALGKDEDPVRRLHMLELQAEITRAGFEDVVCVYRFRDRVVLRARKPDAPDTPDAPEDPETP